MAERLIQTMSSYTGEGVMFTVDTRLRPSGSDGDLVQSEGAYKDYFAHHAAAWEGITYMKSRGVAGNIDRATDFLHELQEVDWRRYGQGMRSRKDLAEMRARLEREQGPRNPLKAGPGGYYDIDFALMYLRLKGAGFFYKMLNTPERIDVIEKWAIWNARTPISCARPPLSIAPWTTASGFPPAMRKAACPPRRRNSKCSPTW